MHDKSMRRHSFLQVSRKIGRLSRLLPNSVLCVYMCIWIVHICGCVRGYMSVRVCQFLYVSICIFVVEYAVTILIVNINTWLDILHSVKTA